jgi:hypothetical protein
VRRSQAAAVVDARREHAGVATAAGAAERLGVAS